LNEEFPREETVEVVWNISIVDLISEDEGKCGVWLGFRKKKKRK